MVPAAQLARLTLGVAASIPVSKIAKDIIANNVTVVTKADAFKVKVGSIIVGTMVARALDNTIDSYVSSVRTAMHEMRKTDTPVEETTEPIEQ